MKLNIYSIFDSASGLYSRPFFSQSDPEALRMFSDIAQDADHPIGKHPADYTLYRLGIFTDTTGKFTDEDNQVLATALELIAKTRKMDSRQKDFIKDPSALMDISDSAGGTA